MQEPYVAVGVDHDKDWRRQGDVVLVASRDCNNAHARKARKQTYTQLANIFSAKYGLVSGMTPDEEMGFLRASAHEEVCKYLATKVRAMRRHVRESQEEFALRAGVPLRTYKRFETHGRGSLETFVQILRAVERVHYLFMLFPSTTPAKVKPSLEQRLVQLQPTKFRS